MHHFRNNSVLYSSQQRVKFYIMNSIRLLVIYTYSCVGITSKAQGITVQTEDLVDEYYTTILQTSDSTIPQDDKDAQAIMDSDRKEEVIAGILSYRDKTRRFAIQQRMLTKINPKRSYYYAKAWRTRHYWASHWYVPQRTHNSTYTFMDLCFGLLEDENVVLGQYLRGFFYDKDETWINIAMVLTKDMGAMISSYDKNHGENKFKKLRKDQRHPFENMLRVWVRHNRDQIEAGEPNKDDVMKDANTLKAEHDSGDWHKKNRDQLELILIYKSIKYARAVIKQFEFIMGNKTIESIIDDSVHNDIKLNHDLADAYSSLARYIKDKYSYMADTLRKYGNGKNQWAAWIMCIAVLHPNEWSKVDVAFQKDHKDDSLTKFIMQNLTTDKVMAEMIAVIIDPNFKPTTFSGNPIQGGSGGTAHMQVPVPPPVPSTVPVTTPGLPPVPPTTPAPVPPPVQGSR